MPFRRINILSNGNVALCCNDAFGDVVLGNVFKENLVDIWNSDSMNIYRLRLFNQDRRMKLCDKCNANAGFYVHMLRCPTFGKAVDKQILDLKYFNPNEK